MSLELVLEYLQKLKISSQLIISAVFDPFFQPVFTQKGIITSMNTKEKLQFELKEALRSGENVRKTTIRMTLSSIKLAEVEKGSELDEASLINIIQKEIKIR